MLNYNGELYDLMLDIHKATYHNADTSVATLTAKYGEPDFVSKNYRDDYDVPIKECDIYYYTGVSAKLHDVDIARFGFITPAGYDEVHFACAEVDCSTWEEAYETAYKWLAARNRTGYSSNLGVFGEDIYMGDFDEVMEQIDNDEIVEPWWYDSFCDANDIPMAVEDFIAEHNSYHDTSVRVALGCYEGTETWLSIFKTDNGWTVAYYSVFE